jgi:hypothetical protein
LGYADLIEQELRPLQIQMLQVFEHHLADHNPLDWGTRLFKDLSGFTHISFTPREHWQDFNFIHELLEPSAPALVNFWGKMKIPKTQAKTLQLELMQLWSKYYFAAHLEPKEPLEEYAISMSLVPIDKG